MFTITAENLTVNEIRYKIINHFRNDKYTYIILGKPGRTGKSWLTAALKEAGLNAIEISEYVGGHVQYNDCKNHVEEDIANSILTIILNKPLEE